MPGGLFYSENRGPHLSQDNLIRRWPAGAPSAADLPSAASFVLRQTANPMTRLEHYNLVWSTPTSQLSKTLYDIWLLSQQFDFHGWFSPTRLPGHSPIARLRSWPSQRC